jgi:hypothetical protein
VVSGQSPVVSWIARTIVFVEQFPPLFNSHLCDESHNQLMQNNLSIAIDLMAVEQCGELFNTATSRVRMVLQRQKNLEGNDRARIRP